MSQDGFVMRPARAEDREAVLAFCRQTWAWGDYLGWVWDDWLADRRGLFAVATVDGRVMGVDKLTFLGADEAFFEGLRVDPAYRGRGYAARMEAFMLTEAVRQGARVARFLTAADNTPVHKNAARHGFRRGPELLSWHLPAGADAETAAPPLVPLAPGPAASAAWAALTSGPLWAALGGLVSASWHAQAWTPARWADLLAAGRVLVPEASADGAPAGLVVLLPDSSDAADADVWLAWIDARPFDPPAIAALLRGAAAGAPTRGDGALHAMLPGILALDAGLRAAGWTPDPGPPLVLFEKVLAGP